MKWRRKQRKGTVITEMTVAVHREKNLSKRRREKRPKGRTTCFFLYTK